MGLLDILGNVATGGVLGSITGIIGSIATGITNYKMAKLKFEQERELKKLNMETMRVQAETGVKLEQAKTERETAVAEVKALEESYRQSGKNLFQESYMKYLPALIKGVVAFVFALMDVFRASVRPVLSYFFVGTMGYLVIQTMLTKPDVFFKNLDMIVFLPGYLTVTIVTWWFADRKAEKFLMKYFIEDKNVE